MTKKQNYVILLGSNRTLRVMYNLWGSPLIARGEKDGINFLVDRMVSDSHRGDSLCGRPGALVQEHGACQGDRKRHEGLARNGLAEIGEARRGQIRWDDQLR